MAIGGIAIARAAPRRPAARAGATPPAAPGSGDRGTACGRTAARPRPRPRARIAATMPRIRSIRADRSAIASRLSRIGCWRGSSLSAPRIVWKKPGVPPLAAAAGSFIAGRRIDIDEAAVDLRAARGARAARRSRGGTARWRAPIRRSAPPCSAAPAAAWRGSTRSRNACAPGQRAPRSSSTPSSSATVNGGKAPGKLEVARAAKASSAACGERVARLARDR